MSRGCICDGFVWSVLMVKCGYGKWCSFVVIGLYVCGGFWFWVILGLIAGESLVFFRIVWL